MDWQRLAVRNSWYCRGWRAGPAGLKIQLLALTWYLTTILHSSCVTCPLDCLEQHTHTRGTHIINLEHVSLYLVEMHIHIVQRLNYG